MQLLDIQPSTHATVHIERDILLQKFLFLFPYLTYLLAYTIRRRLAFPCARMTRTGQEEHTIFRTSGRCRRKYANQGLTRIPLWDYFELFQAFDISCTHVTRTFVNRIVFFRVDVFFASMLLSLIFVRYKTFRSFSRHLVCASTIYPYIYIYIYIYPYESFSSATFCMTFCNAFFCNVFFIIGRISGCDFSEFHPAQSTTLHNELK